MRSKRYSPPLQDRRYTVLPVLYHTKNKNAIRAFPGLYPQKTFRIYKSKLIIFGGRYLDNTALADVDIYNIEHNYWEMNNYNTIIFLKLRRNHVACLVGSQMFVHGGIDRMWIIGFVSNARSGRNRFRVPCFLLSRTRA